MCDAKDMERHHKITWQELVQLEPRLLVLLSRAEGCSIVPKKQRGKCNYEVIWGGFKEPIASLVGLFRRDNCDPRLKTIGAYDVAYWTIYHAMHD